MVTGSPPPEGATPAEGDDLDSHKHRGVGDDPMPSPWGTPAAPVGRGAFQTAGFPPVVVARLAGARQGRRTARLASPSGGGLPLLTSASTS